MAVAELAATGKVSACDDGTEFDRARAAAAAPRTDDDGAVVVGHFCSSAM